MVYQFPLKMKKIATQLKNTHFYHLPEDTFNCL